MRYCMLSHQKFIRIYIIFAFLESYLFKTFFICFPQKTANFYKKIKSKKNTRNYFQSLELLNEFIFSLILIT